MSRINIDATLAELAARHGNLFLIEDAHLAGVSNEALRRRRLQRRIRRVLPRVCMLGDSEPTRSQILHAGILALGPPAAGSHVTAARALGFWTRDGEHEIHVVGTRRHDPVPGSGLTFHQTAALGDGEMTMVDGMPYCNASRTCHQLGLTHTKFQVCAAIREAIRMDQLDIVEFGVRIDGWNRAPGNGVARAARDMYLGGSAGTRSRTEDRCLDGLLRSRVVPEPIVNTRGAGGLPRLEPDMVWPSARLIVEIDGGEHDQPGSTERDATDDAAHRSLGWRVERIRGVDVWRRLPMIVDHVCRLLGAAH
ncbi:MAG: hypothetical protein JWM98_2603 [Thermoleophilia bacterium]|nr:hypothetical protein [Thermoleophilia bacterium]